MRFQSGVRSNLDIAADRGVVAAITGTNGKTTTTTLVGQILKNYNPHTYVVGNIGMPYADVADGMEPDAMTAAEISSFMLESIVEFHPKVSAILNITPDHLNRIILWIIILRPRNGSQRIRRRQIPAC